MYSLSGSYHSIYVSVVLSTCTFWHLFLNVLNIETSTPIYTYLLMGAGLGFSSSNTNLQFSAVRHTRMKENVERRERKKKREAPNCHGRASSVNQPSHLSTIFKRRASYFRQASVTLKYYFVKKTEALEGWV